MNPNAITLTRVWVRETGQLVMDDTISNVATNQVVVEYEAGATINATGGPVNIEVIVWDWTNNAQVIRFPMGPFPLDGANENRTYQQVAAFPSPIFAGPTPALCEVTSGLYDATFLVVSTYKGPMFYIMA